MKTYLTESGLETMKERLSQKIDALKKIREEKAHAYSASGDGWHDNPGWTQLGQQEEILAKEVFNLQQNISNAVIFVTGKMNHDRVNINCIVEFQMSRNESVSTQVMNIVGSGESDIKNRKLSYDSPIGKALFGMAIGEVKEVQLPGGTFNIQIKSINYE
jgi:transcription elongation GreA/GreB family factor